MGWVTVNIDPTPVPQDVSRVKAEPMGALILLHGQLTHPGYESSATPAEALEIVGGKRKDKKQLWVGFS